MNKCKRHLEECFLNLDSSDEISMIYPTSLLLFPPAAPLTLISVQGMRQGMSGLSILNSLFIQLRCKLTRPHSDRHFSRALLHFCLGDNQALCMILTNQTVPYTSSACILPLVIQSQYMRECKYLWLQFYTVQHEFLLMRRRIAISFFGCHVTTCKMECALNLKSSMLQR